MKGRPRTQRHSLTSLIKQVDTQAAGVTPPDTVPTGFPSLDRVLGGGVRRRDLIVLGGDVGSGKSALALAIALRAAETGRRVALCSGEMDEDRLLERALAIESRTPVDDIRAGALTDQARSALGAAAVRLRDLPLTIHALAGASLNDSLEPAWESDPALVVIDSLDLLTPPGGPMTLAEAGASVIRALKSLALDRRVACLTVAHLPRHDPARPDPRPTLDDFGALGSVKQHADVILAIYREEMYRPGGGVEGATELLIAKNRNGPTGFIDIYFYQRCMRFEDMLDPDR
ncbi:MAG TPA: DnaB-like helicase C-terminal domain-containing protein [Gemmatimonadales bacterium]|nr:DnaB-like helicase C-terminal domain-containing protein [Gemmatimonadales bacterium]